MYRTKKSHSGFIISRCNGSELFEFGKEVLGPIKKEGFSFTNPKAARA
jgi:hypothetical protein